MDILVYVIFYLICALNIVWGVKKRRSNLLSAAALIIMFLLISFNYYGPDVEVYANTYKAVGEANGLRAALNATYMEKGYAFLMYCSNGIGFDFYAFRIVITIFCFALLMSTIRFYKANPNFILGLYMAYLFFFDSIQFRNFIVECIMLYATRYLTKKTGGNILKYFLCVAIAASMHTIALIYLSLVAVWFLRKRSVCKNVFVFGILIFAACVMCRPVLPRLMAIAASILKRGGQYLSLSSRFSYFIVMAFHLFSLGTLVRYKKDVVDCNLQKRIEYIIKIQITIGIFMFLCIIDGSFYRIFRNLFVLDMIGMAVLYEATPIRKSSKIILASEFIYVGGWLAVDLVRNYKMNIIGYAMNYNLIFDGVPAIQALQYMGVAALCLIAVACIKLLFKTKKEYKKGALVTCK